MVILDTDHMSLLEWTDSPPALRIKAYLSRTPNDQVATTIINYEEQVRGWLAALSKEAKVSEQIEIYRRLNKHLRLYCSIKVLDFDESAAIDFQRLRRERLRIGKMDLKIAAIARSTKSRLLTRNFADFAKIPDLEIEDATK